MGKCARRRTDVVSIPVTDGSDRLCSSEICCMGSVSTGEHFFHVISSRRVRIPEPLLKGSELGKCTLAPWMSLLLSALRHICCQSLCGRSDVAFLCCCLTCRY